MKETVNKKNGFISIIKFIYCIIIILMHWGIPSKFSEQCVFLEGGYIFVDFFFVLQGFYLIKQWGTEQNAYEVAFSYILSRLRRFFPGVFFLLY